MRPDEPRRVVNGQESSQESKGKQQELNRCQVDQQVATYIKASSVNRRQYFSSK